MIRPSLPLPPNDLSGLSAAPTPGNPTRVLMKGCQAHSHANRFTPWASAQSICFLQVELSHNQQANSYSPFKTQTQFLLCEASPDPWFPSLVVELFKNTCVPDPRFSSSGVRPGVQPGRVCY